MNNAVILNSAYADVKSSSNLRHMTLAKLLNSGSKSRENSVIVIADQKQCNQSNY